MTPAAEHDEIFFAVRPQLASPNYVMDLELIAPATVLGKGLCDNTAFDKLTSS